MKMITEMQRRLIENKWDEHQRYCEQHYSDMLGELTARTGLSEEQIKEWMA